MLRVLDMKFTLESLTQLTLVRLMAIATTPKKVLLEFTLTRT